MIFDMDGVLIDTEPVWRDVEVEVFGSVGIQLTHADGVATMGWRIDEVVEHWYAQDPWMGPTRAQIATRIVDGVIDVVARTGTPLPGVNEAFAAARAAGLRTAVASSSAHRLISAVLGRLELTGDVDAVASAEDELRGKPDPAVYVRAARILDVAPERCVAVEDSPTGAEAAVAAGMRCIVIPDSAVADDRRFAGTERIASLHDLAELLQDAATI